MDERQTKTIDQMNGVYLEGLQHGMVLGLTEEWEKHKGFFEERGWDYEEWMGISLNNAWYLFNKRN